MHKDKHITSNKTSSKKASERGRSTPTKAQQGGSSQPRTRNSEHTVTGSEGKKEHRGKDSENKPDVLRTSGGLTWEEWRDCEARRRSGASPWAWESYLQDISDEQNRYYREGKPLWHWDPKDIDSWCSRKAVERTAASKWTTSGEYKRLLGTHMYHGIS